MLRNTILPIIFIFIFLKKENSPQKDRIFIHAIQAQDKLLEQPFDKVPINLNWKEVPLWVERLRSTFMGGKTEVMTEMKACVKSI